MTKNISQLEKEFDNVWHHGIADALLDYAYSEKYENPLNYPVEKYRIFKSIFDKVRRETLEEVREMVKWMKVGHHPSLNEPSAIKYNTLDSLESQLSAMITEK